MKRKLLVLTLLMAFNCTYAMGGSIEDKIADVASWVVLIVLPIVGIYIFWQVHIYPEKVAEKNHHPQLKAIKTLCLLSLFFGGLLWPFALVWANYKYSDVEYPDEETEGKIEHTKTKENSFEKVENTISESTQTKNNE
ncbi:DUF3302 domain-containing protein [Riemerella anatipestifer]|uniref:DUF3302 domain-containing protein n=1 Tax=Riemerella anatipestifer TaxID=34085 RepID=UPI00129DA06A|nr:DUF3302 domain-containing protein [Riemerella anatipestifer]MRM83097.1 DUF3302 domain-containing protein [Riemerella anatipestifer]